jgi:hypothetical protein
MDKRLMLQKTLQSTFQRDVWRVVRSAASMKLEEVLFSCGKRLPPAGQRLRSKSAVIRLTVDGSSTCVCKKFLPKLFVSSLRHGVSDLASTYEIAGIYICISGMAYQHRCCKWAWLYNKTNTIDTLIRPQRQQ